MFWTADIEKLQKQSELNLMMEQLKKQVTVYSKFTEEA